MSDGKLVSDVISPTAQTVGNPLFGPSGVMTYRVALQSAMGMAASVDVEAATGDDAALAALAKAPGGKVLHVAPAPQAAPTKKAA